jgi:hypothetical protein
MPGSPHKSIRQNALTAIAANTLVVATDVAEGRPQY